MIHEILPPLLLIRCRLISWFLHKESGLWIHRCNADPRTSVMSNGVSRNSRFSFEAFRFMAHRNKDKSSIFIHCILRLCEPDKCLSIINVSKGLLGSCFKSRQIDLKWHLRWVVCCLYRAAAGEERGLQRGHLDNQQQLLYQWGRFIQLPKVSVRGQQYAICTKHLFNLFKMGYECPPLKKKTLWFFSCWTNCFCLW